MPIQSESEKIRLSHAREILARHLCSRFGAWTVEDDLVVGPGTLALRVEDEHRLGPQHLDIGFVLNREDEQAPVIWDCAVGIGLIEEKILAMAIDIWSKSTLPVILELLKRDGSEAAHFHDADPGGCPGWHVIHGPVLAYGRGPAPTTLQSWTLQGNLLSHVGPIATKAFGRPMLNGVKLLFGFGNEGLPRSGLMACATKTRVNSYELSIGHSLPILRLRDASFFLYMRHSCAIQSRNERT